MGSVDTPRNRWLGGLGARALVIAGVLLGAMGCDASGSGSDLRPWEQGRQAACEVSFDAVQSAGTTITSVVRPDYSYMADVYYPVVDPGVSVGLPVALFMQGGNVDKQYYEGIASQVAAYGWIVVVPNHEDDIMGITGLFSKGDQITDILAWSARERMDGASVVGPLIDEERLALIGHSHGAATASVVVQEECGFPFCDEPMTLTRPPAFKAAVLIGYSSAPPHGDTTLRATHNKGLPIALINGALEDGSDRELSLGTLKLIDDPPKLLVFVAGANHYGLCTVNNPPGPTPAAVDPTIPQAASIEIYARWTAHFLNAHVKDDACARDFIDRVGPAQDPSVEVLTEAP